MTAPPREQCCPRCEQSAERSALAALLACYNADRPFDPDMPGYPWHEAWEQAKAVMAVPVYAAPAPSADETGVGEYCHPRDMPGPVWLLMFEDFARDYSRFTDEATAREHFAKSEALGWNCHLLTSVPRAPAPSADKQRFDVFRICDAYESGIGHGLKRDGLCNPYQPASDDFRAYEIGYEEGARRAIDDAPPAAQPAEPMQLTCVDCGKPYHGDSDCVRPLIERAEPTATDDLVAELRELYCTNPARRNKSNVSRVLSQAADMIERQAREIAKWNELHRVIAEELDRDAATWPDHRNAPLAIGATFVLIKQRAERAEAEIESLRAECGLRQIQGYKEGEEAASARLYEAEAEQLTRDMRQRAERAERDLDKLRSDANKSNRILGERCEKLEAERDALRADADRYRWIRRSDTPSMEVIARKTDEYRVELYFGDELDAAIDAARGKVK